MDQIVIRGARENNLKSIDLDLPRGKLVVITGLSGSGKSSLAFDTIYAEGQRRYVESLSVHARQFLERLARPDVDTIEGLSPVISIEQRGLGRNPRSTVGTITEIHDYLRLLYARVGEARCWSCGRVLARQSATQIATQLMTLPEGTRLSVLAPLAVGRKGNCRSLLDQLRRDGFTRARIDGEVCDLGEPIELSGQQRHAIEVFVDRLVVKAGARSRLAESLELAFKLADGVVKVATPDQGGAEGQELSFSERFACADCGVTYPELTPRLFSFNSPQGACARCAGLGVLLEFEEALLVPDPTLSLREGAIEPWEQRNAGHYQAQLERLAEQRGFSLVVPYEQLGEEARRLLMHGAGEPGGGGRGFEGVIPNLQRRMAEQQRRWSEGAQAADVEALDDALEELQRYMRSNVCPDCEGARLCREARHVFVAGRPITELTALNVDTALQLFRTLRLEGSAAQVAHKLLQEVVARLSFLSGVGVGYLTLDRAAGTLSGGEGQRVRLATQIGGALVGVVYVLDEPSIGLHQRDNARLLETLLRLRDLGNTVLVVEHDEQIIRAADWVVDLGPAAGVHGGEVVGCGTVEQLMAAPRSVTGQFLAGQRAIAVPRRRRRCGRHHLLLWGVNHNNLRELDVAIPLEVFVCVTGVSGSGKSSLVVDTLLPALRNALHHAKDRPGAHRALEGLRWLDKVIAIDQAPIGRTPRSNAASYTGLLALIRELFAALPEARLRGYRAGRFSFNVKGGRCEACRGDGVTRIAMHFLPDVRVVCELCGGARYNEETLRVRYKGKHIAEVLQMTVEEALTFFANVPRLREKLSTLAKVGLGYLQLGQAASTMSGGEAQRVKLARELSRRATGRTFYILDEPTTGLHFADIEVLLGALAQLVEDGNSVLVIEHNLDVIKYADWVIDLGPEGGDAGGQLVAAGTPEQLAQHERSHTGHYLRAVLGPGDDAASSA
ncbi:MAG: excinuclease ABC subunit UvrA [Proteobacteria bacterium]|nr:excinuclease ABC subunit UvrA [Pseudomonadota bacterium]